MKVNSVHLAPLALVFAGAVYLAFTPPATLGLDLAGDANHDRPSDQSASNPIRRDARTAALIRNALNDDPSLAESAKRVKIETMHGVVSLKGNVANPAEKAAIEKVARDVASDYRVESHLKVIQ